MSDLKSEYIIDLKINDNTKDAIRALEVGLKDVGKAVKKDAIGSELTKNLEESQKAAQGMIDKFHEMSKNRELDFDALAKSYSKSSGKVIASLEAQYANIRNRLNEVKDRHDKNAEAIKSYNKLLDECKLSDKERGDVNQRLSYLEQEQRKLGVEQLEAQIKKNREIRASLKSAETLAKLERTNGNYTKQKAKLEELMEKRRKTSDKAQKKALDEQIKKQQFMIKSIELAEKAQKGFEKQQERVTKAIQNSEKAQSRFSKISEKARNALQNTYNAAGLIGGAGRLAAGGMRIATAGLNTISQASDKALERERAANRVKGMDSEKASAMIGDVYVKTGADYSAIVDAINRVRSVLGNVSNDELAQAAAIEVRYPGMSLAFASSKTQASMQNVNAYANRMKSIQKATGSNDEQIKASAQKMANYKPEAFSNASITELQAIYLGLQNSGAFESDDELDRAFDRFVRDRRGSDNAAWKDAQNYDWTKTMPKSRDKLQIANTLQKTMNWDDIRTATNIKDNTTPEQTTAEKNAERMRTLEERKNQMLIKLIDMVEPIVNEITKALDSEKMKKLIDGIIKFLTNAVPILADVIVKIAEGLGILVEKVPEVIDRFVESNTRASENTTGGMIGPKYANGGIALGPSLVGERGPEAIIPLDYSRAQRAENIAYSIQNNFTMSGNQTTALSLAQAVSSRDFSRAMSKAAFKAGRMGVF